MVIRTEPWPTNASEFPEWFRDLTEITIHECGHWMQDYPRWARPARQGSVAEVREYLADCRPSEYYKKLCLPPWTGHGADFIRAAFHVWYRAANGPDPVGTELNIGRILNLDFYGYQQPAFAYFKTLERELSILQQLPLSEALKLTPPADFLALWQNDVQTSTKPLQRAAAGV